MKCQKSITKWFEFYYFFDFWKVYVQSYTQHGTEKCLFTLDKTAFKVRFDGKDWGLRPKSHMVLIEQRNTHTLSKKEQSKAARKFEPIKYKWLSDLEPQYFPFVLTLVFVILDLADSHWFLSPKVTLWRQYLISPKILYGNKMIIIKCNMLLLQQTHIQSGSSIFLLKFDILIIDKVGWGTPIIIFEEFIQ